MVPHVNRKYTPESAQTPMQSVQGFHGRHPRICRLMSKQFPEGWVQEKNPLQKNLRDKYYVLLVVVCYEISVRKPHC